MQEIQPLLEVRPARREKVKKVLLIGGPIAIALAFFAVFGAFAISSTNAKAATRPAAMAGGITAGVWLLTLLGFYAYIKYRGPYQSEVQVEPFDGAQVGYGAIYEPPSPDDHVNPIYEVPSIMDEPLDNAPGAAPEIRRGCSNS